VVKGQTPAIEKFPTTQWTNIHQAGHAQTQVKRKALNELLIRYLPAIRCHLIFRKKIRSDQVDDLIQGFITSHVVEKDLIAKVERERGKFRTFLLTALDRYIIGQYRHASAKKRNAGSVANIDDLHDLTNHQAQPDKNFEVEWARAVLGDTLERMQQQCKASGRDDVWGIFECRLLQPILGQEPALSYADLVKRFNLVSPAQASNLLVSAKRMFTRILRTVVGEYTPDVDQIDQEIAELMQALSLANK